MKQWILQRVGIVRLRQILDDLSHRLAFIPMLLVGVAVVASQVSLAIDRALGEVDVPLPLSTTVDSARAIFGAIAGGLITAVTLLLSMLLVAVQLASGQFSPRTLRNWLGDRTLRRSIGIVLASTVFCLMGLRSTRSGVDEVIPTITVLVAVALGIAALVSMLRAVDHVTQNLQIGTVAKQLVDETIRTLDDLEGKRRNEDPARSPAIPASQITFNDSMTGATAVETTVCGWVQQIDEVGILESIPAESHAWIAVAHGAFVTTHSPLVYVATSDGGPVELDGEVESAVRTSFALGPTRTMQQDIGFGLQQLTDIAVRALSPGVNDPQTASDIIVHIGEVLRAIWTYPCADDTVFEENRTLHRLAPSHAEHLHQAMDPIRRYGSSDPTVMATLAATLKHLRHEVCRRGLPGPVEPIDLFVEQLVDHVSSDEWLDREVDRVRQHDFS